MITYIIIKMPKKYKLVFELMDSDDEEESNKKHEKMIIEKELKFKKQKEERKLYIKHKESEYKRLYGIDPKTLSGADYSVNVMGHE